MGRAVTTRQAGTTRLAGKNRGAIFKLATASVLIGSVLTGCGKIWIRHPSDELANRPIITTELPPVTITSVVHSVSKKGETLSAIARRYTGAASNWKKLEAANPKINPHRLRIGDRIVVPGELIAAAEQPTARASLKESLPPAATKPAPLPEKPAPAKKQVAKRSTKPKVAARPKAVSAQPRLAKRSSEEPAAPAEVQRAEPKLPASEMLSETTDLLPEFSSSKQVSAEAASKERVKRGLARKANLASELIDPARLAKRPKIEQPAVMVEKPRAEAPPEVASTFLTCRADRCNIRVASE